MQSFLEIFYAFCQQFSVVLENCDMVSKMQLAIHGKKLWVRSFGVIWISISDPTSVWIMVH